MPTRYLVLIIGFIIVLAGGLIWSANHYHSKYQEEKLRAGKGRKRNRISGEGDSQSGIQF